MVTARPVQPTLTEEKTPTYQVLAGGPQRYLIRSWDSTVVFSGRTAPALARVLTATADGVPPLKRAQCAGVLPDRLAELLGRVPALSTPDTHPEPARPDSTPIGDVVVVEDHDLRDRLAHQLADRATVILLGDTTAARELGPEARLLLPRRAVERDEPPIRALLARGGTWSCYWRAGLQLRLAIRPARRGPCLWCLTARERTGGAGRPAALPGHEQPYTVDTLARTVGAAQAAPAARHPLDTVLYEFTGSATARTPLLHFPVCPLCAVDPAAERSPEGWLLAAPAIGVGEGPGPTPRSAGRYGPVLSPAAVVDRCRVAGGLAAAELDQLAGEVDALLGSGVLHSMRVEQPVEVPDLFYGVTADVADLRAVSASPAPAQAYDAWGAGWTTTAAVRSCLGEAVERYCALVHGAGRRVRWGTAAELPSAVAVEEFATLTAPELDAAGLTGRPATSASPLGWVGGHDLATGQATLVPAQVALLGYSGAAFEDAIAPSSNKGLAAGRTADQCLLHGLCELVEADALIIHFVNRSPVPEIDLRQPGNVGLSWLESVQAREPEIALRAWDFRTDLDVPTVLVMARRHDGVAPIATFGMATRPQPAAALEHAVLEALHATCWVAGAVVDQARAMPALPALESIRTREQAKALGAFPPYLDRLDWLCDRDTAVPLSHYLADGPLAGDDPAAQRQALVEMLGRHGLSAVGVDLSTGDVRAATGRQVWRAVVPGLQPFSIGGLQARASQRLFDVPRRMGHRSEARPTDVRGQVPHPCP